jgi:N-hydroxyarylamine O-acetyltransferase
VSDLDIYRDRLGVAGSLHPDLATLRALQVAHLRTVPFENASVLFGEPIELDQDRFVHKLGVEGRGGFCYELNGAFEHLLRSVGFEVAFLEARGHETEGRLGPRFDHLALVVTLDEPWLVDVGFGYSFVEPLRLAPGIEQVDPVGAFRLREVDGELDLDWRHRDGRWVPHYRLDPIPHELAEFADTCRYHQIAPDSPFTRGWNCVVMTPGGAVTLSDRHYIATDGPTRHERDLTDAELVDVLASSFGVRTRRVDGRWVRDDRP